MKIINKTFWIFFAVLLTVATYAGTLIYLTWPISQITIGQSGVFGDSFGMLTALFSGLAFAGIIISINIQSNELKSQRETLTINLEELKLQREELKLTRNEIKGQKQELKLQNATMKKQAFEQSFFQLLSLHNSIVKDMFYTKTLTGKNSFDLVNREIDSMGFQKFYDKYYLIYNQYMKNLYHIIVFVDRSNNDDSQFYINIIHAQLSSNELDLMYHYSESNVSPTGYKEIIEKYNILVDETS